MSVKIKIVEETFEKRKDLEKEPNSIVFYKENPQNILWYYSSYYYDRKGEETELGLYRIFRTESEMDDSSSTWNNVKLSEEVRLYGYLNKETQIDDVNLIGNNHYFSLALYQGFYTTLYRLIGEGYSDVLAKLRDMTTLKDIVSPFEAELLVNLSNFLYLEEEGYPIFPETIIELQIALQEIDKNLNVGNYIENKNIDKLFKAKKVNKDKITKSFENYDSEVLNRLIDRYLEQTKDFNDDDGNYSFLLSLIRQLSFLNLNDYKFKDYIELVDKLNSVLKPYIETIEKNVLKIKEKLKYTPFFMGEFIHYTSLSTLDVLIKPEPKEGYQQGCNDQDKTPPRLRLSNTRQLNDPMEGLKFMELILGDDYTEFMDNEEDYIAADFYLASMSKVSGDNNINDSLPMWKMYGGETKGVCLTFAESYLRDIVESPNVNIYRVCYIDDINNLDCYMKESDSDDIEYYFESVDPNYMKVVSESLMGIRKSFETIRNTDVFSKGLELIDSIRYLFKEKSYEYENEYRIIAEVPDRDKIVLEKNGTASVPKLYYYLDLGEGKELKYSKVTLGPNAEDIDFIAPYIKHCDRNIKVVKSKIPYR